MRAKSFERPVGTASFREKVRYILGSTHLVPCLSTTTFTFVMAAVAGMRLRLLVLIPTVLLGQFTVGWLNDLLDRHRDRAAGRLDKPLAMGLVSPKTILLFMFPSFVISLLLGFSFGTRAGVVYLVAMLSALLYDLYLKRTPLSILSLIVSFGLLPVFVALASPIARYPHVWMIIAVALLGATVHFLNVIPDFADDAKTGVKGFVHYFSYEHALLLGVLLLGGAAATVTYAIRMHMSPFSYLVVGLFVLKFLQFSMQYDDNNIKKAFGSSKLLTFLTILVLLCGANYM